MIVISKSGETTETKAAFAVVEAWLKKGVGKRYGRLYIRYYRIKVRGMSRN